VTIGKIRIPPRWLSRPERVMAVAAVLLAVGATILIATLITLSHLHASVMTEVAKTRAARLATYALMQASIDAETGQRGFLLTGQGVFLEPYERGRADAMGHITRLRELTRDDAHIQTSVGRAERLAQQAFAALDHTVAAQRRGTLGRADMQRELVGSKAVMDALRAEVASLLRDVEQLVDAARDREEAASSALYWVSGILAALTLIGVLMTFLALRAERKGWRAALDALAQANAAAEDARAKAAASDLAKTRFLAVASHDMRQPLHALTLYLSALQRRVESAEARDILSKMERATQSMVSMFATLLDLARIQAGVVKPEVTTFPLQEVFERIVAEHPGGKVDAPETTLSLHTDPVLVERALRNLVANAMRHGGGHARLSAELTSSGKVDIIVADDGPGISPDDQARIFEEFVRLDGRAGAEGLGLGLAIVKRITDLMGSPIRVESQLGHGARFIFTAQPARTIATAPLRESGDSDGLADQRVLVIDDDPLAREAMAGAMRDLGANVRAGADETDAETLIADGYTPDLIVMDLRIHGELRGVDIARRLLSRFNGATPRVIVVTGDTGAETLAMLRASGFPWLIKPVDPAQLRREATAPPHRRARA